MLDVRIRAALQRQTGPRGRFLLRATPTNGISWLAKPRVLPDLVLQDLAAQGHPGQELVGVAPETTFQLDPLPVDPFCAVVVELLWSADPLHKGDPLPPVQTESGPSSRWPSSSGRDGELKEKRKIRLFQAAEPEHAAVVRGAPPEAGLWPVPLSYLAYRSEDDAGAGLINTTVVVGWGVFFPYVTKRGDGVDAMTAPEDVVVGTGDRSVALRADHTRWLMSRQAEVNWRQYYTAPNSIVIGFDLASTTSGFPAKVRRMSQVSTIREAATKLKPSAKVNLLDAMARTELATLTAGLPGAGTKSTETMTSTDPAAAAGLSPATGAGEHEQVVQELTARLSAQAKELQDVRQQLLAAPMAAPADPSTSSAPRSEQMDLVVARLDRAQAQQDVLLGHLTAQQAALAQLAGLVASAEERGARAEEVRARREAAEQRQRMLVELEAVKSQVTQLQTDTMGIMQSAAVAQHRATNPDPARRPGVMRASLASPPRLASPVSTPPQGDAAATTVQRRYRQHLARRGWAPGRPAMVSGQRAGTDYYVTQYVDMGSLRATTQELDALRNLPIATGADVGLFTGNATATSRGDDTTVTRADKARVYTRANLDGALTPDLAAALRYPGTVTALKAQTLSKRLAGSLDMDLERRDPITNNDVVFQFVAIRKDATSPWPKNVYFTMRFFEGGPAVSPTASVAPDPSAVGLGWLLGSGGQQTGVACKFSVDDVVDVGGSSRRDRLVQYLATRSLHVDVWDGDSMILVGTLAVPLVGALRQARPVGETLLAVPVEQTVPFGVEAPGGNTSGQDEGPTETRSAAPATGLKGQVLVRLVNIGRTRTSPASHAPDGDKEKHRATTGGDGMTGGSKVRLRPIRLPEEDKETIRRLEGNVAAMRRVTGLPQSDHLDQAKSVPAHVLREAEMNLIAKERQRRREETVSAQLHQNLARGVKIAVPFGHARLVEHKVRNPTDRPVVLIVEPDEAAREDVSLITELDEWKRLRTAAMRDIPAARAGLADDHPMNASQLLECLVADEGSPDGRAVYLAPHESILVPFRVQISRSDLPEPDRVNGTAAITLRVAFVEARTRTSWAALDLHCAVRPPCVDRTFRLQGAEQRVLHRAIDLLSLPAMRQANDEHPYAGRAVDPSDKSTSSRYHAMPSPSMRCAGSGAAAATVSGLTVSLRVRCGRAPGTLRFFACLFADMDALYPVEIWEVFVHCLRLVEVRCLAGETVRVPMALPGLPTPHTVRAFSSHPGEISVKPSGLITIPAQGMVEVDIRLRPMREAGRLDALVNFVDARGGTLVHAVMVGAWIGAPAVSRTFDVAVVGGTAVDKRFSYTNRYSTRRRFFLHSSQPRLLTLKAPVMDVEAGRTAQVALTINARTEVRARAVRCLLFINDEHDQGEDCIAFNVEITQEGAI
jgi:hypothetical protein